MGVLTIGKSKSKETPKVQVEPTVITVEVIKEVPVEVIREVIKEVPTPYEVIKTVELVRIVREPYEVIKEVTKEVVKYVEKEVVRTVDRIVPKETIREVVVNRVVDNPKDLITINKERTTVKRLKGLLFVSILVNVLVILNNILR